MLPKGRWVVAAQSILTGVLLVSCTLLASAEEGTNWKRRVWSSKSLPLGAFSKQESTDEWNKVTSILISAKKNATFPGTAQSVHSIYVNNSRGVGGGARFTARVALHVKCDGGLFFQVVWLQWATRVV